MKARDILQLDAGTVPGIVYGERKEYFAAHVTSLDSAYRLFGRRHFRDAYICLLNSIENYFKHVFLRWAVSDAELKVAAGIAPTLADYNSRTYGHNLAMLGTALQARVDELLRHPTVVALQSKMPTEVKDKTKTSPDSYGHNYVNLRYRDPLYMRKSDGLTIRDFCRNEYDIILPLYLETKDEILRDLREAARRRCWLWGGLR